MYQRNQEQNPYLPMQQGNNNGYNMQDVTPENYYEAYQPQQQNPYMGPTQPQMQYAKGGHVDHHDDYDDRTSVPGIHHFSHHDDEDYEDYHQDMDDDRTEVSGHDYPDYYNNILREHLANGGTVSTFHQYVKPVLDKLMAGARYAGKGAASLGRGIASGAHSLGKGIYNRLPAMSHGSTPTTIPGAPRTWAQSLGEMGHAAGSYFGEHGGRIAGQGFGGWFGPQIGASIASNAMPFVPGLITRSLGGLGGAMAGVPAGGFAGAQVGKRIGRTGGELIGRGVGRGIDYLSNNASALGNRVHNAFGDLGAAGAQRFDRLFAPVEQAVRPGMQMAAQQAAEINHYLPASIATRAMQANPELLAGLADRNLYRNQLRSAGMPGVSAREPELEPFLGRGYGRPRSDSLDSFVSARSGSPWHPYDIEPD